MVNLTHSVNIVAKDVISVVSAVPRIKGFNFDQSLLVPFASGDSTVAGSDPAASIVKAEDDKQKSYYEMISDDTDILRIVVQIMNGMSSTATELQKYLSYWDKYKSLWEMDKEAYIRKYAKSNRTPAQFDVDITRYKLQQAEITGETSTHVINFVRIDCNAVRKLIFMSKLINMNTYSLPYK
jgi:dynein heavy chain